MMFKSLHAWIAAYNSVLTFLVLLNFELLFFFFSLIGISPAYFLCTWVAPSALSNEIELLIKEKKIIFFGELTSKGRIHKTIRNVVFLQALFVALHCQ